MVDRGLDVAVVRVVVLVLDREDGDPVLVDEGGGDVVLGRERVGSAGARRPPGPPSRSDEVRRLRRHVCPASGCSRSKRSRIAASTGICRSAHSIRRTLRGERQVLHRVAVSLPSVPLLVVFQAIRSGCGGPGREQALVLALLPSDPGRGRAVGCGDVRAREPGLDGAAKVGAAAQSDCEGELVELDAEARAERPRARGAGSARGCRTAGSPPACGLERRAPRLLGSGARPARARARSDGERLHGPNPTTAV